ncbi:MAG: hypothetical protein U0235_22000 [Polyangiaceae bacterium]
MSNKAEFNVSSRSKPSGCASANRFWEKHNCILMTSEGQAARGAAMAPQRLATELKLPVYVLVDNVPGSSTSTRS